MTGTTTATTVGVAARSARTSPKAAVIGAPIAVLAVGNAQMGDDAFGATTLGVLQARWRWPAGVELVDVGTAAHDLAAHLVGRERVILLDAVKADAAPGTVVSCQKDALLAARGAPDLRLMPCEPGIRYALAMAEASGALPREVMLIGVVPVTTTMGAEPSPVVEVASRIAAIEVVRRVREWGAKVPAIPTPDARPWWKPAPV